jgi:hypothetical protein
MLSARRRKIFLTSADGWRTLLRIPATEIFDAAAHRHLAQHFDGTLLRPLTEAVRESTDVAGEDASARKVVARRPEPGVGRHQAVDRAETDVFSRAAEASAA